MMTATEHAKPSATTIDHNGNRKPSWFADPRESGIDAEPLTWKQQWRILLTIRTNRQFRDELRAALGVDS